MESRFDILKLGCKWKTITVIDCKKQTRMLHFNETQEAQLNRNVTNEYTSSRMLKLCLFALGN